MEEIIVFFSDFKHPKGRFMISQGVYSSDIESTVKTLIFQLENTEPSRGRKPYEELLKEIYSLMKK